MKTAATAHPGYRPSIDGLRAFAVALVIGYHAFPTALPGGFLGVDIFFVISGYLISGILYREFARPGARVGRVIGDFYGRRIRRIFPALAVVFAVCYIVGYKTFLPGDFAALCQDLVAAAGFCLNLVLAGQTDYFAQDAVTRPLLHLWSLGIEEQFYLVWPLLIWLVVRLRVRLLPVAVFLGGCSFCWMVYGMGTAPGAGFFLPQMRFWELLIGAVTAALLPPGPAAGAWVPGRFLREAGAFAGAALIVAGVCRMSRDMNLPNALSLLPTLGTALIICAGERSLLARWLLARKVPVAIGLISYPLYLWHWPLLVFMRDTGDNGNSAPYIWGAIALATLLSWLTYRLVESPVRHGSRRGLTVALPFVAVLVLALAAFGTARKKGFPERFPLLVRDAFAAARDHERPWRVGDYFLNWLQTGDAFRVDPHEIQPGKPTLVLWGDSHAASLYPGYAKYFSGRYNIVQRTVQGTAPILDLNLPRQVQFRPMNTYIFGVIKHVRPDVVVLSANWLTYDWHRLQTTITALKGLGTPHIVVIGPLPQWKGAGLPEQIYNYYRTHLTNRLPRSMFYGAKDEPLRVDAQMRAFCEERGVEYISACRILSDKGGFITRVGETPESIVTFDSAHLTPVGSEYLVSKFPDP